MKYKEPKNPNTDYYALLKSIKYTVTAHGMQPVYHLKLYDKHCKRLTVTEGIVDKQLTDNAKL